MVSELRKETEIPLILFGYFNPISITDATALRQYSARPIDALLVVKSAPEQTSELDNGLNLIYLLVAPTTPIERARTVVRSASGFIMSRSPG